MYGRELERGRVAFQMQERLAFQIELVLEGMNFVNGWEGLVLVGRTNLGAEWEGLVLVERTNLGAEWEGLVLVERAKCRAEWEGLVLEERTNLDTEWEGLVQVCYIHSVAVTL